MHQRSAATVLLGVLLGLLLWRSWHRRGRPTEPISPAQILEQLKSLTVYRWQYREQPTVEHIGPMAQDWNRTFGVGTPTHIHVGDLFGVLLAAIQAIVVRIEALERAHLERWHEHRTEVVHNNHTLTAETPH